jgi:DNA helicase-2/ATP-dependent DNA helicase PcrA
MDAAAWNRILQLLHGIGPKTAQDLIQWATEAAEDPFVASENSSFSKRYISDLKKLFGTLRSIRDPDMPLVEQVEAVLNYYQPILEDTYYEDYPKREPDLEHFVSLAEGYDDRPTFLAQLALDPIELTALDQEGAEEDEPPLVLSTIHSAKGLEFHTVFLIRALEGNLPSRYALKEEGGVDEELRLFYVAITRAEENLFISYPMLKYQRFRGEYLTDPSRFITGIPDNVLEPVELVEADTPDELDTPDDVKQLDGRVPGDANRQPASDARSSSDKAPPDDGLPF